MYILINTHLTIWYDLQILSSKLAGHGVVLPECPVLVLHMLGTGWRVMTDLCTWDALTILDIILFTQLGHIRNNGQSLLYKDFYIKLTDGSTARCSCANLSPIHCIVLKYKYYKFTKYKYNCKYFSKAIQI